MVYMVKNDFALQNYNKKMTYARKKKKKKLAAVTTSRERNKERHTMPG